MKRVTTDSIHKVKLSGTAGICEGREFKLEERRNETILARKLKNDP
jgi:hypothetical protein